MKFLCFVFSALCPVIAQIQGPPELLFSGKGTTDEKFYTSDKKNPWGVVSKPLLLSNVKYSWQIYRNADLSKTFKLVALACTYAIYLYGELNPIIVLEPPLCLPLEEEDALILSPVAVARTKFINLAPKVPHYTVYRRATHDNDYGPFAVSAQPRLTTLQPNPPVHPQMILYDGISNNIVDVDLTNFTILGQVTIPISTFVSTFGIVPTATGPENVVWAVSPQVGIFVVDVGAQSLTATIPTPSLDPGNTVPVGIVFSNDGATAFYAASNHTADSSGNNGALLVFDVASQTLTSTLLLKYAPTALVMAPDGITAYLLSNTGMITYYDVLSGTADLSLSTYTPGIAGGYPGASSQVFIHPDGTRLFWNVGVYLEVFDLTAHKLTNSFNSGLPGALASMQMSQDGSMMWFANVLGNVVILDTRSGVTLGTYQTTPGSAVYPGPAY
jgi:hypothetical protein